MIVNALPSAFTHVAATDAARNALTAAVPAHGLPMPADSPVFHWVRSKLPALQQLDLSPAVTDGDRRQLARLLAPAGGDPTSSMLQQIWSNNYSTVSPPDFLAVRTGSAVTPQLPGGGTYSSLTLGTMSFTLFGGGSPPEAFKGVAVSFGSDATPQDKVNAKYFAMEWLGRHLDDHQLADGAWDRPLFDAAF